MAPFATLALIVTLLLRSTESQSASGTCSNMTTLGTQLDAMLATYDREWPPSLPAAVELGLDVRHATVNEVSATVRLLADFRMTWKDKRLAWNASDWGCGATLVAAERLWLPDVSVLSAAAAARDADDGGLRALLTSEGRVTRVTRLDLSAPLSMDLTAWPHDEHSVTFKFGSRSHFIDQIEQTVIEYKTTVFESGGWRVVSVEASESTLLRGGTQTRVAAWTVRLRRRAAAHALASRATLAAAALALLAAAVLPPAARAPLCAAASLIATLWLMSAAARTSGAAAASAPRALALLAALAACGGAAAAAAAAALRLARCSLRPPRALRSLLSSTALLRKLTAFEAAGAAEESSAWAAAAQLLDALCVLALLLVVLLVLALCV